MHNSNPHPYPLIPFPIRQNLVFLHQFFNHQLVNFLVDATLLFKCTLISKMQYRFSRQGNDLGSPLSLVPAATKEMAKLKANGNQLGFTKDQKPLL